MQQFYEDRLARHLRPVLPHLLKSRSPREPAAAHRARDQLALHGLLRKEHPRSVRSATKSGGARFLRWSGGPMGGSWRSQASGAVVAEQHHEMMDEGDFFLPVEEPLSQALDELVRARMDSRVGKENFQRRFSSM